MPRIDKHCDERILASFDKNYLSVDEKLEKLLRRKLIQLR